jgi:hypothetical protein
MLAKLAYLTLLCPIVVVLFDTSLRTAVRVPRRRVPVTDVTVKMVVVTDIV